jgi:hypothetical protein
MLKSFKIFPPLMRIIIIIICIITSNYPYFLTTTQRRNSSSELGSSSRPFFYRSSCTADFPDGRRGREKGRNTVDNTERFMGTRILSKTLYS